MYRGLRISVVIPARDEAGVIGAVVHALWTLASGGVPVIDAIVVCDNGSTDATAENARAAGAAVVREVQPGYGAACLAALAVLPPCDAVVFVDGDGSVHAPEVLTLLDALAAGASLAIGARTSIARGAMTTAQRGGNWLACALIRRLYGVPVRDLGPLRAIRSAALAQLSMGDRAYGWTVEMQLKALHAGLITVEVPVAVYPRIGRSKISGTWRGVFGAGRGILGTIFKLYWRSRSTPRGRLGEPRCDP